MAGNSRFALASMLIAAASHFPAAAQERKSRIDVEHYVIEAEINPRTQTLTATAKVTFTPLDDTSSASFELNNALNVSKVVDESGRQVPASRSQQDFAVRLNFPEMLRKGKASSVTFTYDGRLAVEDQSSW